MDPSKVYYRIFNEPTTPRYFSFGKIPRARLDLGAVRRAMSPALRSPLDFFALLKRQVLWLHNTFPQSISCSATTLHSMFTFYSKLFGIIPFVVD